MATLLKPFAWFYHEFGLASIYHGGRNVYLIIAARAFRMFAYGTNSLILALFFAELNFSDSYIGLFMTLTLLGDVLLGTFLTLIADRVGRRRILFGGSFLMVLSGAIFAYFENFWVLLLAAVLGVISATGGDFGPFRAIEESVLSQLTTPTNRSDVLAWYVTMSTWGSSIGSEASGRTINLLQSLEGWRLVDAYHMTFWMYSIMGLVNAALVLLLTDACEADKNEDDYSEVPQDEEEGDVVDTVESPTVDLEHPANTEPTNQAPPRQARAETVLSWLTSLFAGISLATLTVMYKLWLLLALDSLADGMVPYSLTNYYIDMKFHPAKSTLGDVTSVAYFLSAVGGIFAGPLARKIGLINTMVFTHIPSSAAVLLFPFPNNLILTVILLFLRTGLNNMDQAPRSAFIAAVVKAEERTSIMGITSMLRTLAAMLGPSITGLLAGSKRFWVAFVVAGACRLTYDVGLYVLFINTSLYEHERDKGGAPREDGRDEEDILEMQHLNGHGSGGKPISESSDDDVELETTEPGHDVCDLGRQRLSADSFRSVIASSMNEEAGQSIAPAGAHLFA